MTNLTIKNILACRENLERVLDSLKDGVIAHDLNRRIFFFNRAAEEITGYDRQEVLGNDCHQVFGAPLCGERCLFCGEQPCLQERTDHTINLTAKNGTTRRIEMSLTLMFDEEGREFGVLASLRDVTDLLRYKIKAAQLTSFDNIIGQDSKMLQVFQQIRDLAEYDYPVHISGETGTGKELVAAAIHNESRRGGAPFVPINCGALPEGLIESELFGHVKGAFSGAIRDKKGRFELAHRGSVFLDEISELSKHMQVKLLRFLQEGTFERVGGEKTVSVNVRIISASNRELKKEIQRKKFRDDLYYRVNVVPIALPPLRERKNDIPLLVDHFLNLAAERHGSGAYRISGEALSMMMDYGWPGNVRELQNAVQFAIVKCRNREISPDHLPMEVLDYQGQCIRRGPNRKLDVAGVRFALESSGGNKVKAAKMLGVGRATLYRFLGTHPEVVQP